MKLLKTSAAKVRKFSARDYLVDAVTSELRKVNDRLIWIQGTGSRRTEYFIYDSLFPHLWRAGRDQARKRTGLTIEFSGRDIWLGINTEHLETPYRNLKRNLDESSVALELTLRRVAKDAGLIAWSSKRVHRLSHGKKHFSRIDFQSLAELRELLKREYEILSFEDLVSDLGPRMHKIHDKQDANPARGTTLAIKTLSSTRTSQGIAKYLTKYMPIFNCFYPPNREQSFRGSNYRRCLWAHYDDNNLPFECGHVGCKVLGDSMLQAAHIVSVRQGGGDEVSNLVFLCRTHHVDLEEQSLKKIRNSIKSKFRKHTCL